MATRPHIPKDLERAVKTEAGHRCAIPTCKQYPVEIHHITQYSEVKKHEFTNLIALCPTCHARCTNNEIDRKSVEIYKTNLGIIGSRYTQLEITLLESLDKQAQLPVAGTMYWLFQRLVNEGLTSVAGMSGGMIDGIPSFYIVELTGPGREIVKKWLEGRPIDLT